MVVVIVHTVMFQDSLHRDLPVEELGFHSVAELLQKVPGVMVIKPPDSSQIMVYRTTPLPDKGSGTTDTKVRV